MTSTEFIVSERLLADVQRAERIERRERFGERYVKTPELDAVRVRMQEWSNLQGAVWISLGIIGAERKKLAGAPGSETVAERFDSLLIESFRSLIRGSDRMKSSDSLANLAPALAAAQAEFKAVGKSGENKFDKYSYANLEDYVSVVRPVLTKHKLCLLSSSEEIIPLDDRTTKNGGCEHAVRVKLVTRIVHESGEWIETSSCGEGQDRADKSVYKAITGARKYALASALNLATTDDPEHDDDHEPPPTKQVQTKREELKPAGKAPVEPDPVRKAQDDLQISQLLTQVKTHAGYPDALANLKADARKAYKGGNSYLRERITKDVVPAIDDALAALETQTT
jgi:hypothetical protein